MTPEEASAALGQVVREQLRAAWDRGMDTAPFGPNALADAGAPAAYDTVMQASAVYAGAVAERWRNRERSRIAGGAASPGSFTAPGRPAARPGQPDRGPEHG